MKTLLLAILATMPIHVDMHDFAQFAKNWLEDTSMVPQNSDNIWHVRTDGNNALDGHSWLEAYATLAQAITDASSGDTIYLHSGTHTITAVVNVTKTLRIEGAGTGVTKLLNATTSAVLNIQAADCELVDFKVESTFAGSASIAALRITVDGIRTTLTRMHVSADGSAIQVGAETLDFIMKDCTVETETYTCLHIVSATTDFNARIENCTFNMSGLVDSDNAWAYGIFLNNESTADWYVSFTNCKVGVKWLVASDRANAALRGITITGRVDALFNNCSILADNDETSGTISVIGIEALRYTPSSMSPTVNMIESIIQVTGETTMATGVMVYDESTIYFLLSHCIVRVGGAAATQYSLNNAGAGTLKIVDSIYDTLKTVGTISTDQIQDVSTMVDILEGDFKINTTNPAQWKWEVLEKGTTTVLVSKDMKDINGDPIINVITPVAEQSE